MEAPILQQSLTTMSRRHLALISLLSLVLGAQAREQSVPRGDSGSRSEPVSHSALQAQDGSFRERTGREVDAAQLDQLNRQKRRDVLREALRAQPEEATGTVRQMSLQQKTELRQQLRQQQEWLK